MDRPLAVGGISGIASSLLVTLARNFALEAQEQGYSLPSCIPNCLEAAALSFEDLPWVWYLAGVVTGLLIGPLVDLLWLWKQRWRRYVLSEAAQGGGSQRALHKVSEASRTRTSEERLREEVVDLRGEVRRLTARLDRQQDDLASLAASFEELSVRGEESRGSASDLGASTISTAHTEVVTSTVSNSGLGGGRGPQPSEAPAVLTWAAREEIARGIGAWIRSTLHRGSISLPRTTLETPTIRCWFSLGCPRFGRSVSEEETGLIRSSLDCRLREKDK